MPKLLFILVITPIVCFGQTTGELRMFSRQFINFQKTVFSNQDKSLVLGCYRDESDSCRLYPKGCYYPFLGQFESNQFTGIRTPFSNTIIYGGESFGDKIFRINDSTFGYIFFLVDTGQVNKNSKNQLVLFNQNGDTVFTNIIGTKSNFLIKETLYDSSRAQFIILGDDTGFYYPSYGRSEYYILQIDGKIKSESRLNAGRAANFIDAGWLSDGNIYFAGNAHYCQNSWSKCNVSYVIKTVNPITGSQKSEKIFYVPNDETDHSIICIDQQNNGTLLAVAIPFDISFNYPGVASGWKFVTDSQMLVLFDPMKLSILKTVYLRDYTQNTKGENYYNYRKIYPLKNEGSLLIGKFCDTRTPTISVQHRHYGFTMARVTDSLSVKWIRNYYYDSTFYSSTVLDFAQSGQDSFSFVGVANETSTTPDLGWYFKTDTFGCYISGCQFYDGIQVIHPGDSRLSVYPNPASNILNLVIPEFYRNTSLKLTVIDLMGRKISTYESNNVPNNISLDISHISSGTYYLHIENRGQLVDGIQFRKD